MTLQVDNKRNPFVSLLEASANFLNCKQEQQYQPADKYFEAIKTWINSIKYHGGTAIAESHTVVAAVNNERTIETRVSTRPGTAPLLLRLFQQQCRSDAIWKTHHGTIQPMRLKQGQIPD